MSVTSVYINQIGTALPAHDVHAAFTAYAGTLLTSDRHRTVFRRMADRAGIAHRYSGVRPGDLEAGEIDADGFYLRGQFPGTARRMARYEAEAPELALRAVQALPELGMAELARITHLIVASCTGFTAPGLDLQLAERLGLRRDVERTLVGFMGCSAAVPALRLARDAVRSDPSARVLVVNLELCTLHLQETGDLQSVLSFMLFGDGAAAALVSAEPEGIALGDFRNQVIPDSAGLITWRIGDQGFTMHLSGEVPIRIARSLREERARGDAAGLLRGEGVQAVDLWAVHAGGRTILDAVELGLALPADALRQSRAVLHDYGNMSSATLMFVLQRMMRARDRASGRGMAMAFGPGMVAETFRFALAA
jgi:predicted naringenin-chalcone synthase